MDIPKLIQEIAILAPPFLLALTLHEFAHGFVAYKLGDPTAQRLGRLSLKEALALWLTNTKAYAKRQMTWFKMDPEVRWFGPEQSEAMVDSARGWLETPALSSGKG